jgi:membrane-associated phospholipid phosphatase
MEVGEIFSDPIIEMNLRYLQELGVPLMQGLQSLRTPELDVFFSIATFLADQKFFFLIIPLIWWFWSARIGAALTVFSSLNGLLNTVLKEWIASPRPTEDLAILKLTDASNYSFPSGHSQMGAGIWTAFFLILAPLYPQVRIGIASTIALIVLLAGVSRSYLGVHFPIDVVAGWVVGLLFCLLIFKQMMKDGGWIERYAHANSGLTWKIRFVAVAIISLIVVSTTSVETAKTLGMIFGVLAASPLWLPMVRVDTAPIWPRWKLVLVPLAFAMIPLVYWLFSKAPGDPILHFLKYSIFGLWIASFRRIARVDSP